MPKYKYFSYRELVIQKIIKKLNLISLGSNFYCSTVTGMIFLLSDYDGELRLSKVNLNKVYYFPYVFNYEIEEKLVERMVRKEIIRVNIIR